LHCTLSPIILVFRENVKAFSSLGMWYFDIVETDCAFEGWRLNFKINE
jgi:hypothetical protein